MKNGISDWQKKCQKIADDLNLGVCFFEDGPNCPVDNFEDDGYLHIRKSYGQRACFDVGKDQSLSGAEQNENTKEVMKMLFGNNTKKINDRVLVDEYEETELCPCCGQEMENF